VGRDTIARFFDASEAAMKNLTFGFMVSARVGEELRRLIEEKEKVILRACCRTTYYPYRNEVVYARIKGQEKPEEALVFTAHLFEQMAYQGANDNASGSASILETARVINKLIREGKIPRPRRSIRFLWVDEHIGTLGYIEKHPELQQRWFANINEDMVGEALIKNSSSFHLTSTPYSLPSYLNDVLANFIEFVGETNRDNIINRPAKFVVPIISPTGTRDPFYYSIDKFSGGSDHAIFVDGGIRIPAVQLGVWPDMWYHTNKDRPDKSDSTQLKRVGVIATAAALYLANASAREALQMAGEVLTRGAGRISDEEKRAYALLSQSGPDHLPEIYKEAKNIVSQSYDREVIALRSTKFFAQDDPHLAAYLEKVQKNLLRRKQLSLANLEDHYKAQASLSGVKSVVPELTTDEKRLARLIPQRTDMMKGYFNARAFSERIKGKIHPEYRLERGEDFEIRNFIDGERSILDIRNAVSAEFRFIPLQDVENYIRTLEIGGMVKIIEKT